MAAESKILNYVKEQLSAGYAEKDIRDALLKQGWKPDEIDGAFSAAREAPREKPKPGKVPAKAETGPAGPGPRGAEQGPSRIGMSFILSIAGGALIVLNSVLVFTGMGDMLSLFVSNLDLSPMSMLIELSVFDTFLVNMIIGITILAASVAMYMIPERASMTGLFILVLSLVTVLIGNGFIIGGIVAVAGGFLAVLGR